MRALFQRFYMFMQGRYGNDKLNTCLYGLFLFLFILNLFFRSWILRGIELLVIVLCLYRTLSKNITKRLYENNKFLTVYNRVKNFFSFQYKRLRDFKTSCYVKCPACKAQLRVPRRRGKHTVRCPKCKYEFKKRIF
ncbi:MAG: zf-TFIIB domain-containing protein [Ruminococcus sp.]